jgi:biopolymer transport protein ExbD
MSLGRRYGSGPRTPSESAENAVELDITPVMNLFIIIIPFLITMAVFTHVYVVDFGVPPNVGAGLDQSQGKPKLRITVVLAPTFVAVTHGDKMLDSLEAPAGVPPIDTLRACLVRRRAESDIQDEVVVAVRDAVVFDNVVKVMDVCRTTGFTKLGLSSATEQAGEAP